MDWADLFERAGDHRTDVATIRERLDARRGEEGDREAGDDSGAEKEADDAETPDTDPTRIVADADVLAADLLAGDDASDAENGDAGGNAAREAMDEIRSHSWLELVASDRLLDDAEAVIADLANPDLAGAWRERIEDLRVAVDHPAGDHPALASAYRGRAAHVLSYDEGLRSAEASASLGSRLNVSVKTPPGFVALFDAESLYEAVEDGAYPGPDRDPEREERDGRAAIRERDGLGIRERATTRDRVATRKCAATAGAWRPSDV